MRYCKQSLYVWVSNPRPLIVGTGLHCFLGEVGSYYEYITNEDDMKTVKKR